MNMKLLQKALNAATNLDIKRAKDELDLSIEEHAEALFYIAPNIARALVAIAKLNMDKLEAEAN